jgi:calcineurin-like phosphoesterase family protein
VVGDMSAGLKGRQNVYHELLKCFKGKKILVRGNHDYEPDDFYLSAGFIHVCDYIKIGEYFICHYPCVNFNRITPKEKEMLSILNERPDVKTIIHGHIHNKPPKSCKKYKRINACVDYEPNNYYPQQLDNLFVLDFLAKFFEDQNHPFVLDNYI